ncbi:MAG: type II secretion system protein [Lachnospiraceae bacterium]|nr:type II secretion system protein [Lachnospiraceae bacterium]
MKGLESLKKRAHAGTTLVEMVVTLLVFSILMSMVVAVLHPATSTFIKMQKLQYAQMILDNTIQELRGMALEASGAGYVKIYDKCGLNATGSATDLTAPGNGKGTDRGRALEFINLDGYVLLISADGALKTDIYMGTSKIGEEEKIDPGRLLARYYFHNSDDTYEYKEEVANSPEPNYLARAVTPVFADGSGKDSDSGSKAGYYMGNYVEVVFSFPDDSEAEPIQSAGGTVTGRRYPYLNVEVSLYSDPNREEKDLVVRDTAVLNFRYPIRRLDEVTAIEKTALPSP